MSKYVPDSTTKNWVIIADSRTDRGENNHAKPHGCIFCENNEHLTPQEVYRLGPGHPNTPGWHVRVLQNKYPITDIHEVVIHSPHHEHDFEQFTHVQSERVLTVFKDRFNQHKSQGQVLIFNNHGLHAGASQTHPHSQIAVFPRQIDLGMLTRQNIQNVVLETAYFDAYCPDFSRWPYETWITPKKQETTYGDIDENEIADLSLILKRITRALSHIYLTSEIFAKVDRHHHPFGYNFSIYPHKRWYLRIIPRFIHLGGIEISTDININVVDPNEASAEIRDFLL